MRPETRYTKSPEGGYVAYQLFGSGSVPLVFVTNWITNCDAMWEEPTMAAYFDRMGKFARVLCFDKRGTGVSDPVPLSNLPRLEEWMDDVSTVMDAAQVERAALVGDTEGGPMAMMFAASHPERSRRLSSSTPSPVGAAPMTTRSACRTRRRRSSSTAMSSTTA
jgi:pimeloyl-ACP methyl ester carboxylesterase